MQFLCQSQTSNSHAIVPKNYFVQNGALALKYYCTIASRAVIYPSRAMQSHFASAWIDTTQGLMIMSKTKSTVLTPEAQAAINAAMMPTPQAPAPVVVKARGPIGITRAKDVPWGTDKALVMVHLASVRALSPDTAAPMFDGEQRAEHMRKAAQLAAPYALSKGANWCMRHFSYHASAAGLIGVLPNKFGQSHGYYLTPAGVAYYAERMASAPIVGLPTVLVESPKPEPTPTPAPKKGKGKGK